MAEEIKVTKKKGVPRNIKNVIPMGDKSVNVYASPTVSKALQEVTDDMNLYHGVRLGQLLEAVYLQGQKDGANNAFSQLDEKLKEAKNSVPHRNPGKPKKK